MEGGQTELLSKLLTHDVEEGNFASQPAATAVAAQPTAAQPTKVEEIPLLNEAPYGERLRLFRVMFVFHGVRLGLLGAALLLIPFPDVMAWPFDIDIIIRWLVKIVSVLVISIIAAGLFRTRMNRYPLTMVVILTALEGSIFAVLTLYARILALSMCCMCSASLFGLSIYTWVSSTFDTGFATKLCFAIALGFSTIIFFFVEKYFDKVMVVQSFGLLVMSIKVMVLDISDFINGRQKLRVHPTDYTAVILLLSVRQFSLLPIERYQALSRRQPTTTVTPTAQAVAQAESASAVV